MKKILLIIAIIIYSLFPKQTLAYGRTGHSIIAEIAFASLDPKSKANVTKFLDGLSIEDAANWMDVQRSDPSFDYLKPLHYVNIPKDEKYNPESEHNIVAELNRIISDFDKLNTLTDDAIKMDLLELFHLIGDLHQPLHCGFGDDKGGNTYQVQFNDKGSNLHKVWDSEIIEYKNITFNDVANFGNATIDGSINVLDWMNESRVLLKDIYPANHKISNEYIETNTPIIKKQLLVAGIRLLTILNHYFKDFNRTPNFVHKSFEVADISLSDINNNINKDVRICTKVHSTKHISSGITFLNLGAEYPNSPLTIVIFKDKLSNFKNNPDKYYDSKNICVTGKLILYKGKPEIVVSNENEIVVK